MAATARRRITITYSGDVDGEQLVDADNNATSPASIEIITLDEGPNTITINMAPNAITITSAQGTKQCESIGECLQTLLELYDSMSGKESGEGSGEAELMAGYSDQAPQQSRPINGMPVK